MKIKKNDVLSLEITDITNLGFGVAKHGGEVIFVSDTVPGDRATVKIIKSCASYAIGRAESFDAYSPLRTSDRCQSPVCKSCAYKHLEYSNECKLKQEFVAQAFKKSGLNIDVAPLIASPSTVAYRNKAQYPVTRDKNEKYNIGFFAPKSHRVTEAASCPLAPSVFFEILEKLRAFFEKNDISTYDENSGNGLLRHIYLRRGEVSGEILLTVVINGKTFPNADELVSILTKRFSEIVGILLNVNTEQTNIILGDEYITLFGRDYIYDTLAGVKLKISAPSFYQVNHDCAELLYAKARELAEPTKEDLLLDLYCGAGSIGLSMARDAKEVIGIEIVSAAVECAKHNAEINGIDNASFYTGDAADTERLLQNAEHIRGEKILPDIVILDPPRSGSEEKLLSHIASLAPRKIVYISCNPTTLARDMVILKDHGYTANEVTPVDMFPGTGHVESVVCLIRKEHS